MVFISDIETFFKMLNQIETTFGIMGVIIVITLAIGEIVMVLPFWIIKIKSSSLPLKRIAPNCQYLL